MGMAYDKENGLIISDDEAGRAVAQAKTELGTLYAEINNVGRVSNYDPENKIYPYPSEIIDTANKSAETYYEQYKVSVLRARYYSASAYRESGIHGTPSDVANSNARKALNLPTNIGAMVLNETESRKQKAAIGDVARAIDSSLKLNHRLVDNVQTIETTANAASAVLGGAAVVGTLARVAITCGMRQAAIELAKHIVRTKITEMVTEAAMPYVTSFLSEELGITPDQIAIGMQIYSVYQMSKSRCFVAGTQVVTKDGTKNIEDVRPGDYVLSRDEETGEQGFKRVLTTYRSTTQKLVTVTFIRQAENESGEDGDAVAESVTGTPEHPFWSVDRQTWVELAHVAVGEHLRLADGGVAVVLAVEQAANPEGKAVRTYNLEVEDWHTYFVAAELDGAGNSAVWVHNKCHGNDPNDKRAQHGYEIKDTKTGEVVKTGVSGGKRTVDGGSYRANSQANKWNNEAGEPGRYVGEVQKEVPAGPGARTKILEWEAKNAEQLRLKGQLTDPDKHVRP